MDVEQLAGSFVVEIGLRQAWLFLGFCDNRPTPAQEARLYIDASWTVETNPSTAGTADDDIPWLTAAAAQRNNHRDGLGAGRRLTASMTDAGITLIVSGEPESETVDEPWRLNGWHPA